MNLPIPRRTVLYAAVILFFGVSAWVAVSSGPMAPTRVTVTQVARKDVSPALFGIGTVEARRAMLIGPTLPARVKALYADVGDLVRAGQLLADLDPVDLDERVSSSAAASERGRSAVATAEAQARDVRQRRDLAAIEARRNQELARGGIVSQSLLDAKLLEQASTESQLVAAEAAVTAAKRDFDRLSADLGGQRQQRKNFRLFAPSDGRVTSREAEPGSTVIAGQAVLRLEDPNSLWVTVRLDQGRSASLQAGLPADIVLRSRPNQSFRGQVARVEPVSDSITEERIAQVTFEALPPGTTTNEMADVTIRVPSVPHVLTVPNACLRSRGVHRGVWVRRGSRLQFLPVQVGAEGMDGEVQILQGLKEGDEVVVYSERELEENERVKVVPSLEGRKR